MLKQNCGTYGVSLMVAAAVLSDGDRTIITPSDKFEECSRIKEAAKW